LDLTLSGRYIGIILNIISGIIFLPGFLIVMGSHGNLYVIDKGGIGRLGENV
jgi:hypothetical protein